MLDFVQQLVSGIALGCVYGLIALGFVLVYKATEVVNFAQGDLMMLGGFFAFTFISLLGFNYWLGFIAAVAAMALFGMLAERLVVRPILGYPQFSIIMATIGLGFFLRSVAGMIWGTDDLKIETPFSHGVLRLGSLVLAYDKLSVIVATIILCVVLYFFFNRTRLGTAMRASTASRVTSATHRPCLSRDDWSMRKRSVPTQVISNRPGCGRSSCRMWASVPTDCNCSMGAPAASTSLPRSSATTPKGAPACWHLSTMSR